MSKTKKVNRSAESGEFVSADAAKANPKETFSPYVSAKSILSAYDGHPDIKETSWMIKKEGWEAYADDHLEVLCEKDEECSWDEADDTW